MKNKLWKELIVAVLLISTTLSFSPIAYGQTTSVQQSVDAVKMEMKQAALSYVEPAFKKELTPSSELYPLLNSVKKNYQATKKLLLASNLSEKEKQAKLKELEALYEEKIVKGLIPYIDAYNYAMKYLEPLLKEVKEAEAKNDFLAVETAYHKLSVQLKSRTAILYRFTGKAPRDLLLERYKKPADATRNNLIVPVTIIMKATATQQLLLAGKKEDAQKAIEEIQALAAKLSNTNPFNQALGKELERLQAILFPAPVIPKVPTPPVTGGGGGTSGPSKSSDSTIKAVTVIGFTATESGPGTKVYNVELPIGTILADLEETDIDVIPTHAKATETTTGGGATWQVVVTAEDGKSTTTYTINVTITPSVNLATDSLGTAGNGKITGLDIGTQYIIIIEGTNFYGVLADGKLSTVKTSREEAADLAVPLTGTEITGLTNGTSYKVETALKTFAEQFPDPNLANAIAVWLGKNVNATITKADIDSKLAELSSPTTLDLSNKNISSMDGFAIFNGTNLEKLDTSYNPLLTSLNVSGLTSLHTLNVSSNPLLMSLDVSDLTSLKRLDVNDNPLLTSLNVDGLTSLQSLTVFNTSLASLDVSSFTSLQTLRANGNPFLVSLIVSGLTGLYKLEAHSNPLLTSLDVRSLTSLKSFFFSSPTVVIGWPK